jgi:MoaA/NifB/PqqE/SkfB family radical SAM enzyme
MGLMDENTLQTIIEKAIRFKINNFILSGFGEPLLNQKIILFIKEIKSKIPCRIQLNTNGGLLTEDLSNALLDVGLDSINVNVNGTCETEYQVYNNTIPFKNLINSIKYMLEARKERNARLLISVQKSILDNALTENFTSFWIGLGVDKITLQSCNNRSGYLKSRNPDTWNEVSLPFRDRYCRCFFLIAWNGEVYSCTHDLEGLYSKGPISEMNVSWLIKEQIPLCKNCDISHLMDYYK